MEKIILEKVKKAPVLLEVTAEFEPGSLYMIMGASGSGKTTLLNLLAGILKPDEGRYLYGEKEFKQIWADTSQFLRETVGYIFQSPQLLNEYSVLENILAGVSFFKKKFPGREEWIRKSHEIAEYLEIGELLHKYPDKISGGEQQRAAIARALLKSPQLLLCDEPTSALHGEMKEKVMRKLKEETVEKQSITVVVSHDWELLSYADKGFYLKDGKLTEIAYEGQRKNFGAVPPCIRHSGVVYQNPDGGGN